ncbi:MAG TPA: hypothetical protein PKA00_06275 [Saprospiraceae bacterium]|nr:hypothetical protein [Saprospiraceae bacterium]HMQ82491.1 hypothetical protein [Saprospiraceae bacterium]
MPNNNLTAEQILSYLQGEMTAVEKAELEKGLQAHSEWQEEVRLYQDILAGFSQLKNDNFRQQLQHWNKDWQKTDQLELIEWYHQGELPESARQKMLANPTLSAEIKAYQPIYDGFQANQTIQFLDKMQQWEKSHAAPAPLEIRHRTDTGAKTRRLMQRLAIAASFILALGLGTHLLVKTNYQASKVVSSFYAEPTEYAVLGDQQDIKSNVDKAFQEAHEKLQQKDYAAAYTAFDAILKSLPGSGLDELSKQYYQEQCEWNRLLSSLPQEHSGINPNKEAQRIAEAEGHEYQKQAQALSQELESIWYRWAN